MLTHLQTISASWRPLAPPEAVPHSVLCSSAPLGWHGIIVWRRQSLPALLSLPPLTMHDVVVQLRGGPHLVQERSGHRHVGPWRRGDLLLVPAGRPSFWDSDGAIDNLHLSLDPGFVQRLAVEACGLPPAPVEFRDVFAGRDPQIAMLGRQFLRELTTAGLGGPVYAESLATVLVLHLLRTYSTRPPRLQPVKGGLPPHALRQVLEYMEAHLEEPFGVATLAALVSRNTLYFLRMFKHSMGETPHQYLIARRMERAKAYLTTSAWPVTEIALRVGWTPSHFTKYFRRLTGLTPTAYRHAHRHSGQVRVSLTAAARDQCPREHKSAVFR